MTQYALKKGLAGSRFYFQNNGDDYKISEIYEYGFDGGFKYAIDTLRATDSKVAAEYLEKLLMAEVKV